MSDNGKKRRGGASGGDGGRRKKGHYLQSVQQNKGSDKALPIGCPGILVTCDAGREFKAFDEMQRLLEESFQRLGKDHVGRTSSSSRAAAPAADGGGGGGEAPAAAAAAAAGGGEGGDGTADAAPAAAAAAVAKPRSIADELAAEVAGLKQERRHRFKRHATDVRGTVFVGFPDDAECPTPEEVAHDIASHVRATRSLPARFVLRLLPVSLSSFASQEELAALVPALIKTHFPEDAEAAAAAGGTDFAVEFEHRSCDKLKRTEVINLLAQAVPQPPYKVNLGAPQRTILVQLVRNVAALSVAKDFKQLCKYNLRRLTEEEEEGGGGEGGKQGDEKQQQQQEAQEQEVQEQEGEQAAEAQGETAEAATAARAPEAAAPEAAAAAAAEPAAA